ncbi:5-(carboxyamino)imidazole ribonucleotide mutase [Pseudodesulfovibrio methanolicus]|uniref:N5-carboxyaminoimidazole ribonucleotide mutase n=1 Tax=Pseudodesulfovibrio methanolicus TaxID=3126690 RepID=A0ABZ2IWT2_9BACT
MPQVVIFMGSVSDEEKMRPCSDLLKELGVDHVLTVSSAHRTPERTARLVEEYEQAGAQVFICAAGLAAHLAGAVAAKTIRPVLGVPLTASPLGGMDALLATLQMPPGFPVGTLALDKVGAKNAAWLAAQIIALHDETVAEKIRAARQGFKDEVERAAAGL